MPHAIIHGNNCSRHEVDFENAETADKVLENEQNLELMAEVLKEEYPWQKKCFALISLVRLLRSKFANGTFSGISPLGLTEGEFGAETQTKVLNIF